MNSPCSALLILALGAARLHAQAPAARDSAGIEVLNRAIAEATRHMDTASSLALWTDDGTSLLPSTAAVVGKPAITSFLGAVMTSLKGARMLQFDMRCHDIQVAGDSASEWCTEHQVVHIADGQPDFDGWGRMLYVLRRGADGRWRIRTEMWQPVKAELPT